ncbi:hypothetical protein CEY12_17785 [Chryseobacterium sp. T16E-39]|uniref:DUF2059 domain-containing protein n=1 Tax=Chryseobacterium sp. T16E-39 TaxID=2015076 RepID=UPI000B5B2ECD|nr:DUF2059 domain-containing protein [Chryseobacterium sp. T16E-39]ASK31842.1 hypothetical protein CEY12_17785 [Chryseobacterium sp. T16E-39]
MKKAVIVCALFLGISTFSQVKESKIKELIILTEVDKLASQEVKQNIGKYQKAYPGASNKFWEEFLKEMSPEKFADLYAPIYSEYYTESEIDDLIKFYNTSAGKKMMEVTPLILKEGMKAGEKMGKETVSKLMKKID